MLGLVDHCGGCQFSSGPPSESFALSLSEREAVVPDGGGSFASSGLVYWSTAAAARDVPAWTISLARLLAPLSAADAVLLMPLRIWSTVGTCQFAVETAGPVDGSACAEAVRVSEPLLVVPGVLVLTAPVFAPAPLL
jgi:hypothetical protein